MELTIYNQQGAARLTVSPDTSSVVTEKIMGEYSVTLNCTHTAYVPLDVNDYIEVDGVRYTLKLPYRPTMKNTQTYKYAVKFYAPIHDAESTLFLFVADGDTKSEFSLTAGPREHMQLLVDNLNRHAGKALWSLGTIISAESATIDYNNVNCWDAAFGSNGIAAAFETELWADGYVLNLVKCETGIPVELGYMQGLTSLQPDASNVAFFTRLYPLGSTRNIDPAKYGSQRLQLPDGVKYVDRGVDKYGVIEHIEESAFSAIFPQYVGTVSAVRAAKQTNEDGEEYTVYYIKDSSMTWNPDDYTIAGLVKKISFLTGDMAGYGDEDGAFEANWHNDTREWEIINIYPADGMQIPGGVIVPKVGDKFAPWNFRMPDEYVRMAEQNFKTAVDNYLDATDVDANKYTGDTDYIYCDKNDVPLHAGQSVTLLSEYFTGGQKTTRIIESTRKLNNLSQATIVCADKVETSWKKSVDGQLDSLEYLIQQQQGATGSVDIIKTTDRKTPTNYNVFSALRSQMEHLSKRNPDIAQAAITFLKGLYAGEWSQGSKGVGIYQDGDGNWHIETDYLDVRLKFTAKEVEIQRFYHISGAQIKSSANLQCVRVEDVGNAYRCYMNTVSDEGVKIYNQFKVNDQAYVQTFNIVQQADGTLGNHFLWRLVTAVGEDYIDMSKTVAASGSDVPKVGDAIVQLGYRGTDDPNRQTAVIDAGAGNGSPYYRQYTGINSFSLPAPETQLKPGDNLFTGQVKIQPGSTGAANLTDLPDEVYKAVQIGGENLLMNTAFTGDYQPIDLKAGTSLSAGTDMYSPQLMGWSGTASIVTEDSFPAGYAVERCDLSQVVQLINGETYVCGYWAKGGSYVEITLGSETVRQAVTADKQFYSAKIQYSGSGAFRIKSDARVYMIKLERGTVATDWCPNVNDAPEVTSQFKSLWYIQQALQASTKILGGLILSSMIQLGEWENGIMQRVTAGISGIWNDDSDVSFWSGGTYEQAIATVNMIISGKTPTDADWKNLAKFVVTHGGDLIIRGYVYALGGVFRGTVYAESGEFNGLVRTAKDGKRIEINPETQTIKMYTAQGKETVTLYFQNDGDDWDYGYGIFRKYINGQLVMQSAITPEGIQVKDYVDNTQVNHSAIESIFRHNGNTILRIGQVKNFTSASDYEMLARISSSVWPTMDNAGGDVYIDNNGFLKIKK